MRRSLSALLLAVAAGGLFAAAPLPNRVEGLVLPFQQVTVSARVSGLLATVAAKEGDATPAGQILAQLANAEEQIEVERAARVMDMKDFDSRGAQELLRKEIGRKDEALEKKTEHDIAVLQHRLAQVALERKVVRAPIAGIVVLRRKEAGEWVEPGAPLFELVSFDRVYVQVLLPHEQAKPLALGRSVEVELPQLDSANVVTGLVDFIDPRVDASSGYQRVKVLLENPGRRILPGTRAVLRLPAAAR